MLLLSFTNLPSDRVSKFLVQAIGKDSSHFSPSSVYLSQYNELILETFGEKKKNHHQQQTPQKPTLSEGTGTLCSDRGEHRGISAALLSVEVHSQLQTAHNLSCCPHGAVKNKKQQKTNKNNNKNNRW